MVKSKKEGGKRYRLVLTNRHERDQELVFESILSLGSNSEDEFPRLGEVTCHSRRSGRLWVGDKGCSDFTILEI